MNELVIVGAGGHGKVIADIARLNGFQKIVFLDDDPKIKQCGDYPVVGICSDIHGIDGSVIVAIGNARVRRDIQRRLALERIATLIHPKAVVCDSARIGCGTVVMAGAVINSDALIGKGCIINTASSVDHDCRLDDYVHVAVGAHLCGTVKVGDCTWIGAGAIVSNNVDICSNCMIGAGAVVVDGITEQGTYVGIPARKINAIIT